MELRNSQPTHIAKDTEIQFIVWKVCVKTKPRVWLDYFLLVVQRDIKTGICNHTEDSIMKLGMIQGSVKPHKQKPGIEIREISLFWWHVSL